MSTTLTSPTTLVRSTTIPYGTPPALIEPPCDDAVKLLVADCYTTAVGDVLFTVEPDSGRRVDLHKNGRFHWATRNAESIIVSRNAVWSTTSQSKARDTNAATVWVENSANGSWWADSAINAVVY